MDVRALAIVGCAVLLALACDDDGAVDAGARDAGRVDAGRGDAGPAGCVGQPDGAPCGAGMVCVAEACAASTCGDGVVDARSEACDDGNGVAFDGCEPGTCAFTCVDDSACDDGDRCNGMEGCSPTQHVCVMVAPADPPCQRVPGSITALGGARVGGQIVVSDERFEGLGYGCGGSICAVGRIGP